MNAIDKEITVLVYVVGDKLCFMTSSLVAKGVLQMRDDNGSIIKQKVISNSNFDYMTISNNIRINNKTITVCIISNEISYEKRLRF